MEYGNYNKHFKYNRCIFLLFCFESFVDDVTIVASVAMLIILKTMINLPTFDGGFLS